MKLGILTTLFGRRPLTLLFLDRMKSIQDRYGAEVVAVGSDNEYLSACQEKGIRYVDHINKPLGTNGIMAWENSGTLMCRTL